MYKNLSLASSLIKCKSFFAESKRGRKKKATSEDLKPTRTTAGSQRQTGTTRSDEFLCYAVRAKYWNTELKAPPRSISTVARLHDGDLHWLLAGVRVYEHW